MGIAGFDELSGYPRISKRLRLIRLAEAEGGFGTIIKRGDADRGALILLITSRGEHRACLERTLGSDGIYGWQRSGPEAGADNQSFGGMEPKTRPL